MKLYRLDYYQDDCGELIGFFTSKEAAKQYAFHDRKVDSPTRNTWTEIWRFTYSSSINLEEKLDGMISTEKGLSAWEKGSNMNVTYYQ